MIAFNLFANHIQLVLYLLLRIVATEHDVTQQVDGT